MMPNFSDRYKNKSSASLESQLSYYTELINLLKQIYTTEEMLYTGQNIHNLLFSMIAKSNFNETMVSVADDTTNQIISMYSEYLRPNNIVITTDCPSKEVFENSFLPYLAELREQIPNNYSLLYLPYHYMDDVNMKLLTNLIPYLAKDAKILLYNVPEHAHYPDSYTLIGTCAYSASTSIMVLQLTSSVTLPECYHLMTKELKIFLDSLDEEFLSDSSALHEAIKQAQRLEDYAAANYHELRIPTLKNELNNLKTILLDLLYADSMDIPYFISKVKEQANETTTKI